MDKSERIESLEKRVKHLEDDVFAESSWTRTSLRNELTALSERADKHGLMLDTLLKHLGLEFHIVVDESINGINRYNELRPIKKDK